MKIRNTQSRRAFIKGTTLMAIGVAGMTLDSCNDDDNPPSAGQSCTTTDDILGPYYKAGAPEGENIIPEGDSTPALIVQGFVMDGCETPLAGATIEIWNANAEGVYDTSDNYFFRGKLQTPADGTYKFRTIVPGRYLNGSIYRPSHIHFRITAPGYNELVSQIYFTEDPFIQDDPWASAAKAKERILTIQSSAAGDDIVNFDIHLKKTS
jgi:catechol 1,2-dioxygenase